MTFAGLLLAVIVGTWNGQWFPSGRAEHRANPEVEAATIRAAGGVISNGIARLDAAGTEDVILVVNEMRGPHVTEELAKAIGRTNLNVAVITGYRRRDRFDMQQDAILTTLPIAGTHWSLWKSESRVQPPRGFACADLVLPSSVTVTVYGVHLKSNYGATTATRRVEDRAKREMAARQLVQLEQPRRGKARRPVIVAGDFNADKWKRAFADEATFEILESAGFENVLERLPPDRRGTYPNAHRGDSAFDYIFLRGLALAADPVIGDSESVSDHNPVFVRIGTSEPEAGGNSGALTKSKSAL